MLFKILKLNFLCFSFWPADSNVNIWKTKMNIFLGFFCVLFHAVISYMVFKENNLHVALVAMGPATTEFLTIVKILYIFVNFEKFKYIINKIIHLLKNSINIVIRKCIYLFRKFSFYFRSQFDGTRNQ